eukprot:6323126-Alexandrium_andersonii.AAC.1
MPHDHEHQRERIHWHTCAQGHKPNRNETRASEQTCARVHAHTSACALTPARVASTCACVRAGKRTHSHTCKYCGLACTRTCMCT